MTIPNVPIARTVLSVAIWLTLWLPTAVPATDGTEKERVRELLRVSKQHSERGHLDSALVDLEEVLRIDPDNQDAWYYRAVNYLALTDTAQALSALTNGMEKVPLSSRLKFLRVRLHLVAGETDEARQILNAVKMFKPNNPEAMYLEGMVSLVEGDSSTALALWESALEKIQARKRRRSDR